MVLMRTSPGISHQNQHSGVAKDSEVRCHSGCVDVDVDVDMNADVDMIVEAGQQI